MTQISIRQKLNYFIIIILIIIPHFIFADNKNEASKEAYYIQKLNKTEGPNRLPILRNLMETCYGNDKQIKYLQMMADEGKKYDSTIYIAQAYTEMCCYYFNREKRDSIFIIAPKAMSFSETVKNWEYYYLGCSLLCSSKCNANQFAEAVEIGNKAYNKAKKENNIIGIPMACEILGNIYSKMNLPNEAIRFLEEERLIYKRYQPENHTLILQNYLDYIPLLLKTKDYEKTISLCNEFEKRMKSLRLGENYNWAINVCNLWNKSFRIIAYSGMGMFDKASRLLPFTSEELKNVDAGTKNQCQYAEVKYYYMQGNFLKAYNIIEPIISKYDIDDSDADMVIDILEKNGNSHEAISLLKQLYNDKNSLLDITMTDQLARFNSQFHLAQLQNENSIIKQSRMKIFIWLISIIALFLLIIVFIIGYIYRKEYKMNVKLKKMTNDLHIALKKADESNKLKSAFLENISHEIRTPLNAVVGFSNYFSEKDSANEEDRYICEMINVNSNQLLEKINNIIDISKFESDTISIKKEECNLNKLLTDALEKIKSNFITKDQIEYFIQLPQNDDIIIFTDIYYFNMIIDHLLTNAAKFTEKGSIILKLERKAEKTCISITDTGCGIKPEMQQKIFNSFTKTDEFKTGLGIGLSLCKLIADKIDCTIELDKKYTNGSRFIVSI